MTVDKEAAERLRAFFRGEMTSSEVGEMTAHQIEAIAQLGCELANGGRLIEARVIFERLVAGNPQDAAAQAALGTIYQKLGRVQDALSAYAAALRSEEKNPVALANQGELKLKQGDQTGLGDLVTAVAADVHGETAAGRRAKTVLLAFVLAAAAKRTGEVPSA